MKVETENRSLEARETMPSEEAPVHGTTRSRGRGRPILMSSSAVLEKIRRLGRRREGLFRVHHTHPGLYARARRQFGSWAAAVGAAGMDYGSSLSTARQRSVRGRRRRRRSRAGGMSQPQPAGPTG